MVNSDDISIHRAGTEEASVLTQTCRRAFDSDSEFGAPGPGGPPGYDSVEWNLSRIRNNHLQYYKINCQEDIIGGFIAGDRGPGYQVCERIWIDPEHMRKGIGERTFELIWNEYPSADVWVLGTPEWNTRTNPFYQKVGFSQIGITRDYPTWNGIYYQKRIAKEYPRAMSKIVDLQDKQNRVIVDGYVEQISNERIVASRKTNEELRVADAILSDDTEFIKLVLWNDQIRQVKSGTSIRIEEGYVKEYRGDLQLSLSQWGIVITLLNKVDSTNPME
ncbi:MAG: GNAT family N-acetyltransferase [Candidatus Thorarchaeota archaeon]